MIKPIFTTDILRRLASLLTQENMVIATQPPRAPSSPASRPAVSAPEPAVEHGLTELLATRGHAVGGRIRILNLNRVMEKFGPRWPGVANKVDHVINSTIARRLSRHDHYTLNDDGTYLLVFNTLSEAEAELKCSLLAEEIATKLLGHDAAMDVLDVRSAVATIDGKDDAVRAGSTTVLDALRQKLAEREPPDSSPRAGIGRLGPGSDTLAGLLDNIAAELSPWQAPGAARMTEVVWDRLNDLLQLLQQAESHPVPPASHGAAHLAELRQRISELLWHAGPEPNRHSAGTSADAAPSAGDEVSLAFFYRPMWQVRLGVINAYCCQLTLQTGTQAYSADSVTQLEGAHPLGAAVDQIVLRRALADIHHFIALPEKSVVVIPVHFATLASYRKQCEYLRIIREMGPQVRPYLVWEIINPPIGFMPSALAQAARQLKSLGRAVLLRTSLHQAHFDGLAHSGIYAVGTDLSDITAPETDLLHRLERFRIRAEYQGLKTYVHGLSTLSLTTAVIGTGFDHIDGSTVAPLVAGPDGIHTFKPENIFQQLFASAGYGLS